MYPSVRQTKFLTCASLTCDPQYSRLVIIILLVFLKMKTVILFFWYVKNFDETAELLS